MTNTPIHTHTDDRSELLSGYLDRALDVAEQRQAERTIAECAACAEELADLRSLQTMLRALPAPIPRRSFTIDPATVRPRRLWFPIFRFASLAAAVLLFVVVGIDALPGSSPQSTASTVMLERKLEDQQAAPAAGGAAPEFSAAEEAAPTLQAPAAVMAQPEPTTAAAAAAEPTSEVAAASEPAAADAPAAEATEAITAAEAAPPAVAGGADATSATAAADEMPMEEAANEIAPESTMMAGGEADLRQYDTAAGDTQQFTATGVDTAATPMETSQPIDLWRTLAYVLAVFVVGLGTAWWWTARRGI